MRKPYFKILSLILSSAIIATSVDISTLSVYARTSSTDASIVESTELREDAIADDQVEEKGVASDEISQEIISDTTNNGKYGDEIVAHDVEATDGLVAETAEEVDEVATYEQEDPSDEWEEPVNPDGMYVEFADGTKADVTYGYKDTGIGAPFSENAQNEEGIEGTLPSSYDSRRDNGYTTSVKNQDPLGTCWAFASMATMEASMLKNGYATKVPEEPYYSPSHLTWMFYNLKDVDDPQGNTRNDSNYVINWYDTDRDLRKQGYDIGGNAWESTIVLSKWLGAANEKDFPYDTKGLFIDTYTDNDALNTKTAYSSAVHLQNARMVSFTQPEKIKQAIMEYGTVQFSYAHYNQFYNELKHAYYLPVTHNSSNHAVTLVGWDDNFSKEKFMSYYGDKYYKPTTNGAWLVKNSWGDAWGDDGYFWISYADGYLSNPKGGAYACYVDAEPVDNYDNNYFYDGGNVDIKDNSGIKSAANIFTANRDEDLKAVSIMLGNTDINYTIQIYLNPEDNNPESGVPMLSSPQTGHTDYAGYYTIPLDETVALDEGDRFAVVFKSTKSLGLFIDQYANWNYGDNHGNYAYSEVHDSYAKEEQSYYSIGSKWVDFNEGYGTDEEHRGKVARIHAFTDDAVEGKEAPSSIDCINLRDDALSLEVGEYYDVETKLTYANEAADKYKRLIYTADDPTIAYVDNKGHVVAKKAGRTKITVASKIQPEVKKEFMLYVLGGAYVTLDEVTDGVLEYDFATKEKLYGTISCEPEEYTPNTIEWISSNEKVIAFEEGTSANEMKKELLVKNPGKTDITVMMNGKRIARYSVTVQPKSDSLGLTMNAYLKFSGEVELKWSGNDIIKGYKVVDAANKVRYSCNKNEENNYTYKERSFVGKILGDNNISLRVIALYDYYETATKVVTKAYEPESEGKVEITGRDFDERVVSIKCIMNYPHSSADLSEERHYSIKYKDNEVVFGIDDDVPTEWYEKYEVNSWWIYGVGEAHIGDYVNEVFADSVIWSLDKGDNYECDVTLVWSKNEVKAVQFSIPDSGELILDSGTKLRLSTSTPGARIRYRILNDVDNNGSITVHDTHVIEYNANGYIELNYSKKNEDDPDIALINIVAWAEKDNYYNSVHKEISYNVRAKNWGTIPAEVYNADDCEYKGDSDSVPKKLWAYGYGDRTYTGSAITFPDMKVFYYKTLLVEGKDYTVKYSNNTGANTEYKNIDELSPAQMKKLPCITITGKGDYSGVIKKYFSILPMDISDESIEVANALVDDNDTGDTSDDRLVILTTNNNKEQKILPIIKTVIGTKAVTLKNKKDYEVIFDPDDTGVDFKAAGSYKVKVKGLGNYNGDFDYYIDIVDALVLSNASVSKIANKNYNNGNPYSADDLDFTVKIGREYLKRASDKDSNDGNYYVEVEDKSSGTVKVTIIGTGVDFNDLVVVGRKTVTFNIVGTSMKKVAISLPKSVVYKGAPYKIGDSGFDVSIKDPVTGDDLEVNTDYIARYINNTDAGTATFEFTGINGYEGTVKKTFKIIPYSLNDDKIEAKLVGAPVNGLLRAKYTKKGSKPNVEITFKTSEGTKHLEENKDYKLTYVNNGAVFDENGNSKKMPTVKIVGKGNYTGTNTELVFLIKPQPIGNTDDIRIVATDTFAGKFNSTITLYDVNSDNAKLKAGTDYDKNINYRYENETIVQVKSGNKYTTVRRGRGSSVGNTDIIPAGTEICALVNGINNYDGRRAVYFRVAECDIAKANVDFDVVYNVNGGAIEPDYDDFIVTYKNVENPLIALEDYEIVEFTNNTKAGTATMTIRGLGTYGGIKTVKFKINATKLQ